MEQPCDNLVINLLHLRMMALLIHLVMLLSSSGQCNRCEQYQHILQHYKKHMLAKIYHPVPMYLSDMMQFPDHYNIRMMDLSKHSNEQPSITLWKSRANIK